MTIFWLTQIQLAVLNLVEAEDLSEAPGRGDFARIVRQTPSLMDSGLWKVYYSKDLLFSPDARESWCFPDLQPLPAFIANPLQQQQTPTWVPEQNQDRLLRFALIVAQASMSSGVRRGALVKKSLQALEKTTIRIRSKNQQVPPYSETQSYFWIQIVHACLLSLDAGSAIPEGPKDPCAVATKIGLPVFKSLFKITGDEWRLYYTDETWNSVAARREFALPDLKPLPNIIDVPEEYRERMLREKKLTQDGGTGVNPEELSRNEIVASMIAMAMSEEAEVAEVAEVG